MGEEKSRWDVTRWASGTSSMRRKSRAEVERKEALGSEELKGGIGGERDIAFSVLFFRLESLRFVFLCVCVYVSFAGGERESV